MPKTVKNALSQRAVFAVEMVTAGHVDDFRLSQKERTRTVFLVSAVETLNHGRIDWRERRSGWQRLLAGAGANQTGDTDLEIGCGSKAEERQLNDASLCFG